MAQIHQRGFALRNRALGFLLSTLPVVACAGNFLEETGKLIRKGNEELTNAARDLNTAATEAAKKVNTEVTTGARDANTAGTELGKKLNTEATNGLETVNKAVTDGIQHAAEQAKELNKNVKWNLEKAGRDTEAETGRFGRNLEDAAHAIGHYIEREAQGTGRVLSNAERRIREGKVVDAMWHLATERAQISSENAAKAAQESAYVNTVAQVAATAYGGGPQGAAAYAAWLTYSQTGNADLALRAGILTFATSSAFAVAKGMDSSTSAALAKKAAVTASIGGLAVAAAGGDPAAIKEGFLQAGAMVLVQDGYKHVAGSEIDGRASEGEAYCMQAQGEACSPPKEAYVKNSKGVMEVDMSKVDPRRPHVGTMAGAGSPGLASERGLLMTTISKIPGMNAMAVFHDQWVISWDMNMPATVGSIVPAVVLTYTGTGTHYYEHLRTTAMKSDGSSVPGVQSTAFPAAILPDSSGAKAASTETTFGTSSAILSVACVDGDNERTYIVDTPGGGGSCRVVSIDTGAPLAVVATSDKIKSCVDTVSKLVTNAQTTQSCFSRDTASMLRGREPPPEVREAVNTLGGELLPSFSNFAIGLIFLALLVLPSLLVGYGARDVQHRVAIKRATRKRTRRG